MYLPTTAISTAREVRRMPSIIASQSARSVGSSNGQPQVLAQDAVEAGRDQVQVGTW